MTKEIALTQNKVAIVDAADFEWLSQWKWHAHKPSHARTFYAVRNVRRPDGTRTMEQMHQVILGKSSDHKDGNGLNNTRDNLRPATHQQNQFNRGAHANSTSNYKGVWWDKARGKWQAGIKFDGKQKYLGRFTVASEAAAAYDAHARELFGEFARLNFPQSLEAQS